MLYLSLHIRNAGSNGQDANLTQTPPGISIADGGDGAVGNTGGLGGISATGGVIIEGRNNGSNGSNGFNPLTGAASGGKGGDGGYFTNVFGTFNLSSGGGGGGGGWAGGGGGGGGSNYLIPLLAQAGGGGSSTVNVSSNIQLCNVPAFNPTVGQPPVTNTRNSNVGRSQQNGGYVVSFFNFSSPPQLSSLVTVNNGGSINAGGFYTGRYKIATLPASSSCNIPPVIGIGLANVGCYNITTYSESSTDVAFVIAAMPIDGKWVSSATTTFSGALRFNLTQNTIGVSNMGGSTLSNVVVSYTKIG